MKNLGGVFARVRPGEENGVVGRYGLALLAICLLAPAASSGQSLAEVARKERERRARTEKTGSRPTVISEEDLEAARGDSFSVTGTEPGEPSSEAPGEAPAGAAAATAVGQLTAKEIRDLREEWARIWQGQMSQAEKDLERAKNDVYQCRSAERYFFVPIAVDCDGVDLRLATAEARLRKVKSNRYNWELLLPENPNP
jgi:hypothetical protein